MTIKSRILKNGFTTDGYHQVKLYDKNKLKRTFKVHKLIAITFLENPESKPEVNHKDGNKQNNEVSNLEWATHSENQLHAYRTGLKSGMRGTIHVKAKLTDEKVLQIRELYASGLYTQKYIGDLFGVHQSKIGRVIKREDWSHVN